MRSQRGLEKCLRGNQKKTAPLCEMAPHERHFSPFALEYLMLEM